MVRKVRSIRTTRTENPVLHSNKFIHESMSLLHGVLAEPVVALATEEDKMKKNFRLTLGTVIWQVISGCPMHFPNLHFVTVYNIRD